MILNARQTVSIITEMEIRCSRDKLAGTLSKSKKLSWGDASTAHVRHMLQYEVAGVTYTAENVRINYIFKVIFKTGEVTPSLLRGGLLLENVLETPVHGKLPVFSDFVRPPITIKMLLFSHAPSCVSFCVHTITCSVNWNDKYASRGGFVVETVVKAQLVRICRHLELYCSHSVLTYIDFNGGNMILFVIMSSTDGCALLDRFTCADFDITFSWKGDARFFSKTSRREGHVLLHHLSYVEVADLPTFELGNLWFVTVHRSHLHDLAYRRLKFPCPVTLHDAFVSNHLHIRDDENLNSWNFVKQCLLTQQLHFCKASNFS